eukprot:6536759-Prymnesium_polylepis.1
MDLLLSGACWRRSNEKRFAVLLVGCLGAAAKLLLSALALASAPSRPSLRAGCPRLLLLGKGLLVPPVRTVQSAGRRSRWR